jgi:hypothetical protein
MVGGDDCPMRIYNYPHDQCLKERPYFKEYKGGEFEEKETRRIGINVECCENRNCSNYKTYFYPSKSKSTIPNVLAPSIPISELSELGKKYYFVHNYFKTDKIIPYKILQPRGDTGFKGLEDYVRVYRKHFNDNINDEEEDYKTGLNNYKEYIKTLKYDDNLPPAQSNIGIFFWLASKEEVNKNIDKYGFINKEFKEEIGNFSYIFDVDAMIKYILSVNSFNDLDTIPKIYWSDSNIYGLIYPNKSIRGFYHIDFVNEVDKRMHGTVLKTHEVVSLVSIDTTDVNSGFLGILPRTIHP